MVNSMIEFHNDKFGKLTILKQDGEFFFLANEVAKMLAIQIQVMLFLGT